jgi:hypothetical protein
MSTLSSSTSTAFTANALSGFNYYNGAIVVVKFTKDVGANATINISSKGVKPIYYQGAAITAGVINANDTAALVYNYIYNRFELICTDHVPTKTSDLTNDSNFVDATNDSNVITATTVKFFDGIDNYVTLTADYDNDFECNTIKFTDLYSGNSNTMTMAPGGYRLNLGAPKKIFPNSVPLVNGVGTLELTPGYNITPTRFYGSFTGTANFVISTPTYDSMVIPEYYIYFPPYTTTGQVAGITFNMSGKTVYWKDGVTPTILADMQNDNTLHHIVILRLVNLISLLGEVIKYK